MAIDPAAALHRAQLAEPHIQQKVSCCTQSKVERWAHHFFAILFYSGAVMLAAAAVSGAISGWFLLGALYMASMGRGERIAASKVIDWQNPGELARIRMNAVNMTFRELLARYSLRDILNYRIVEYAALKQKTLLALQVENDLALLPYSARSLFEHMLISRDLYQAIADRNIERVRQLARGEMQ